MAFQAQHAGARAPASTLEEVGRNAFLRCLWLGAITWRGGVRLTFVGSGQTSGGADKVSTSSASVRSFAPKVLGPRCPGGRRPASAEVAFREAPPSDLLQPLAPVEGAVPQRRRQQGALQQDAAEDSDARELPVSPSLPAPRSESRAGAVCCCRTRSPTPP